jgi:hypothetical protein
MRKNSRRRGRGLALAVIALSASLPQMAWAQQSGLFPVHPARKRHKVPCDHEDPIYKISRYQYFGYHPTCWHRFPDGWGCPSADAPDREKSFKETPLGSREEGELEKPPEPEPGMEAPQPRPRGNLPPVPGGERSIFDMPQGAPGAAPPGTPPSRRPAAPTDPFESPDVGGGAAPKNNTPKPPAPANPPGGNAADPGPSSDLPAPRASRDDDRDGTLAEEADGPVLALPNISLPPLADANSVYEPPPIQAANFGNSAPGANTSSTMRRGPISGFFSNLGINWLRR